MDRVAQRIAAAAVAILLAASPAAAETRPPKSRSETPARRASDRRLDEIRIQGSVERPEVLFFLPRARFGLFPVKSDVDWREEIRRDDIEKADIPR